MRYRPHLSDQTVVALLENRYGLALRELAFLPVGEDGWAYRAVDSHDGRNWFVQLRQQPVEKVLAVTAYLREQAGLDLIPPTLSALDGSLSVSAGGLHLTVCPYIHGRELMGRPPASAQVQQIGRMLAQLHAAVLPNRLRALLPVETYARHQDTARRVQAAGGEEHPVGSVQSALAGLVRQRSGQIEQVFTRAHRLGEQVRRLNPACVVCHADIHSANIIEDASGRLWIIDWDGLILAPPERDLSFWRDSEHWPAFQDGYASDRRIEEDLIRYYGLEWVVQEIADYGENIFFLPLSDEQKAHSLEEFSLLFEPGNLVDQALHAPSMPPEGL
jgi:spectinomycin phosphotransferase